MRASGFERQVERYAGGAVRRGAVLVRAVALVAALWPVCARAEPAPADLVQASLPAAESAQELEPRRTQLELHVRYAAPAGCPSGAEFLAAVHAHLAEGGEGAVDAVVEIQRLRDGAYELVLQLRVVGTLAESRARAASCQALMQLAALNASMARTPGPAVNVTRVTYLPGLLPPPPSPRITSPLAGERGPLLDDGLATPASDLSSVGPSVFALAEVRAAGGMLPHAAWGQALAFGVRLAPWSLRVSAARWQPDRLDYAGDGGSPIRVRFEQRSLELGPCLGYALSPWLSVEGCAVLAGHHTRTSVKEGKIWASLAGAGLVVLHPWRGLRLEAAAVLQAALSAPRYAVETLEDVYRSGVLQPGARLALGWDFGASAERTPPPPSFERQVRWQARRAE